MNKEETESALENQIPDPADEQFWDDFSRNLWMMFKKAESFNAEVAENIEFSAESSDDFLPDYQSALRETCLTFTRCAEISRLPAEVSKAEKSHLQNCHLCARRVEKSRVAAEPRETMETAENTEKKTVEKSWWKGIFQPFRMPVFGQVPGKLVLTSLAVIILFAAAIFVLLLNFNEANQQAIITPDSPGNSPVTNITDTPTNEIMVNEANVRNSNINKTPSKTNNKSKPDNSNDNSSEPRSTDDLSYELAFLSNEEREDIQQSVLVGKIKISGDLSNLAEHSTLRRSEKSAAVLISPQNEATLEIFPLLSWQSVEESEYQVKVLDLKFNEIAQSDVLTQNSWRIDKKLPAGFYFWQVLVRKKGSEEFIPTKNKAYFKIVSNEEKSKFEKARSETKSNLIMAILYARAGLLREAEQELYAELKKRPDSIKARKMLAQVLGWRRK